MNRNPYFTMSASFDLCGLIRYLALAQYAESGITQYILPFCETLRLRALTHLRQPDPLRLQDDTCDKYHLHDR